MRGYIGMYFIPKQNYKKFAICGILQAHKDGYRGEGITMMEWEKCNPNHPMYHGKIRDPFNIGFKENLNSHGGQVVDVKHQVAPSSIIYIAPSSRRVENNKEVGGLIDKTLPFIYDNKIHLAGASLGGADSKAIKEGFNRVIDNGTILSTSAGNKGELGLLGYALTKAISVGAVGLDSLNKIVYKSYSSRGKELDYTMFSGVYVHDATDVDRVYPMEGTSFSYPMFEGMLAITQQMFLENAGRTMYQDEMINFLDEHLVDLGEPGWDASFGKGLFILPRYNEIEYHKYLIKGREKEIMNNKDYFNDDDGKWHEKFNNRLAEKGIIQGFSDGNVKANQSVTRGEVNKIVSEAIDYILEEVKEMIIKQDK